MANEAYTDACRLGYKASVSEVVETISMFPTGLLLAAYSERFHKSFNTEWSIMCN